jgi:hypothetical protein
MIGAKTEILMVGDRLGPLMEVSRQLDRHAYAVSIAEAARPLDYLLDHRSRQPTGVVVRLAGNENVAAFRAVGAAYPETSFVFLAPRFPPRPAIARVVAQYHGAILRSNESPLTTVASLVALIYQRTLV